jgi:hypothetical protein
VVGDSPTMVYAGICIHINYNHIFNNDITLIKFGYIYTYDQKRTKKEE